VSNRLYCRCVDLLLHLVVLVLFHFSFQENYGRHDAECARKVIDVYRTLELPKVYSNYEQTSYDSLLTLIDECSGKMPAEMFRVYARKIYKRQK